MNTLKKIEIFVRQKILRKKKKLPRFERQKQKFLTRYPKYTIGPGTYGLPKIYDWNEGSTFKIGGYCSIAPNVQIFLGGHHRTDWITTYPFPEFVDDARNIKNYGGSNGNVEIGSDVWVCANSIILSGVKVGHGAVIANGAVVTKDVPAYTVVAGNPARPIKLRFNRETSERLLACAWWDWPAEEIKTIAHLLCAPSVDALLNYAASRTNQ